MKFKVWDIEKAQWDQRTYVLDQAGALLRLVKFGMIMTADAARYVTVYGTGRPDMKGSELFVGDVVECKIKRNSNFQHWKGSGGEYVAPKVIVNYSEQHAVFVLPQDSEECWRRIGNVYESPELLGS